MRRGACFLLLLLAAFAAAPRFAAGQDLGRIDFPTSGSAEAQRRFLRGVLLLHSFEYEDAAEEFREAQKIDPVFAMAYWGEAMTHNHPIWVERDAGSARKILERLAPAPEARLAKAPTERERGYLRAVETLFADGEKGDRDRAYADEMRRLYEAFPDDLEARSFYALALLGTCQGERDIPTYMRAAGVAEEVFARNRDHPGAVHYLIHSYDDPVHAPLGIRAARIYSKIAPAAGHALHMPSHIFLASGVWKEVAASNEASWKASLDRARRKELGADAHSHHALSWLAYAYLQEGRYADARRSLSTMEEDARRSDSKRVRMSLGAMKAAYLVETRRCEDSAASIAVDVSGLRLPNQEHFLAGFCALQKEDRAAADKALAAMTGTGKETAPETHTHGGARSGAYARPSRSSVEEVLRKELESLLLFSRGEKDAAVALAREAAAAEDAMSFEFGPPDIVKPTRELLGEMLLKLGRPAEAREEFELSLARAPRRALSLLGLARAASQSGDVAAAERIYGELREVWSRADRDLAELGEVRDFRKAAGGS